MKNFKEWKIERADKKGNLKPVGVFIGSTQGYNILRNCINYFLDSEEGYNDTFRFTKVPYSQSIQKEKHN